MTDDTEAAAERLEGMRGCTHYDWENASVECIADMWKLAEIQLAQRARSREPITVEGLVAMGFVYNERLKEYAICVKGESLCVSLSHGRFDWWDVNGKQIPESIEPQNMQDVHDIINRLSRG